MTLRRAILAVALGVVVIGCGSAASVSSRPSPTIVQTAAPSPSSTPTASPVPPTPAPSPSAAVACVVEPQTGVLPSDRITNVEVLGLPGRDVVRFTFGESSLDPAGAPTGMLEVAEPPFTGGSSGLPVEVKGEHVLQVVFKGMSLQNDVGQPVYDGPREFEVSDSSRSLRHAVLFDEFEGQIGWYVGYDGTGCVSLTRKGDTIVLSIDDEPQR